MTLHKIKDFDPDYRDHFEQDVIGFDLYAANDKVGSVDNLLVDERGQFRYLVINTGLWIFGKKVLLPIGQARISFPDQRVYVDGLTHEQVENLPEYDEDQTVDYDQEERVRNIYRPMAASRRSGSASVDRSAALEQSAPLGMSAGMSDRTARPERGIDYDRDTYDYDRDPDLYHLNDQNHQNLRLYEERLIANKNRYKAGEVKVGKHVETETARVSVPTENERVVVERVTPPGAGEAVEPGSVDFQEGEVARVEVYEETPDIHKEAFVREEVRVRKEVDRKTVDAEETLRKERLDIDTEGSPNVKRPDRL